MADAILMLPLVLPSLPTAAEATLLTPGTAKAPGPPALETLLGFPCLH